MTETFGTTCHGAVSNLVLLLNCVIRNLYAETKGYMVFFVRVGHYLVQNLGV